MEALGATQSSHILNKDRKYFGVKSEMLILGEPPYTRPVRTVVWEPLPASVC